jgi:hypothetical protein
MTNPRTTVCVLMYGNFVGLAMRCLDPLFKLHSLGLINLRLGFNEVSSHTLGYANDYKGDVLKYECNPQIYKYPMMRKMFNEPAVDTEFTMWFDDDSFITETQDLAGWLNRVESSMSDCDMLGSVYTIPYTSNQKEWCKTQPWYTGKPLKDKPNFATGGWWTIRTSVLKKFDWPIVELKHCGGDVALGVLLDQNNLRLKHFKKGVAINADGNGKESASPRRGASNTEKAIGKNFVKET